MVRTGRQKVTPTAEKKSCMSCPAYALGPDQVRLFGKNIGAPVCGRYGKVLGRPGDKPKGRRKIAELTAASCPAYGHPMPKAPERREFSVVFPDTDAMTADVPEESQKRCSTCASCSNLVRDTVVVEELGWAGSLCAAKGSLIFPTRYSHEARGCEYRRYGTPRASARDLRMLPEFDDAFGTQALNPIEEFKKNQANFIDPVDYETDQEVTEEDAENGIRAWRLVRDPEGYGADIYLPIYDIDRLPPHLREEVPRTGDEEAPELYVDHMGLAYQVGVMWQHLDETPALWGQAGTGKTEFARWMAWQMCLPFHRISISNSTELDDLAGKMHFDPERGTYFEYGRLPKAWTSPGIILLDEPNVGPPDVWQFIRPLTDNSKVLRLDLNQGERVQRNANAALLMAMNPAWDPANIGALELSDADANRLMHIHVELPPEEIEREIIKAWVRRDGWEMPEPMLNMVMRVGHTIREMISNNTLAGMSWAVRPQVKVARALRWYSPLLAYRRAVSDNLDPEKRDAISDIVRAVVDPDDLPWG